MNYFSNQIKQAVRNPVTGHWSRVTQIHRSLVTIVLLCLFAPLTLKAQKPIPLVIQTKDTDKLPLAFRKYERELPKEELEFRSSELITDLRVAGFATASIDRQYVRSDTAYIVLFLGRQYTIGDLTWSDSIDVSNMLGLRRNWQSKTNLSTEWLTSAKGNILREMENNGYPYARIQFTDAELEADQVRMHLDIEKGPLIRFDTIHNVNDAPISRAYLSTYSGIKEGRVYDQSLVEELDGRLAELPFVRVTAPSRVWFSEDGKSHVEVFLEKRQVSKFDFLIGVLPNNAESGKVLVTGEAGVSLWNLFGTGKKIDVGWKRLKPKSQQLKVYFDWPYLFGIPLGADVHFNLDKQDTSFLDLDWSLGVNYHFRGNDRVRIVVHNTQTFLQNPDTVFIRQNGALPTTLDQSTLLSGFELYFERLDYLFNPSRGWEVEAGVSAGIRKIRENTAILEVDVPGGETTTQSLYDSLGERSAKFDVSWKVNYYLPIAQRHVFLVGMKGSAIYNSNLLVNELKRIGGNSELRGFDEESIFASLYNIGTIEYRYLLDRNANLSLFFDGAYVERRLENDFSNDFLFGFGAGLNFETKAGIFGVSYAIGKQTGNPLDFRSSKIHFGYVNIF